MGRPFMHEKKCTFCQIVKLRSEFYPNGEKRIQSVCKNCNKAQAKADRAAGVHRERRARTKRKGDLKRAYGITLEHYQEMLDAQQGGCAICSSTSPGSRWNTFAVDHCHTSGAVRGLLCTNCNIGLGLFKDDTETLERALTYLRK